MTEIAVLFAEKWQTTPFDVLAQDVDDFFMIANSLIKKTTHANNTPKKAPKKDDGFWDM